MIAMHDSGCGGYDATSCGSLSDLQGRQGCGVGLVWMPEEEGA